MDKIVELLRNEVSRDTVQQAVQEQETVVTKFVSLLLKEESSQAEEKKKEASVTVTDDGCRPGG